jgi:hypothetical protein
MKRPFEPRERDYALVAHFMCLWIGFECIPCTKVSKYLAPKFAAPLIITASLLAAQF